MVKNKLDTEYVGTDQWVNKRTGEIIEANQVLKRVPRNGFEITYLSYFMDLFDALAGKKYQVFKYIMEHKTADNTLIITTRELVRETGTSATTVQGTLNLLKDAGLITKKTGAIMLNPKLAMRGSNQKEKYLLQRFEAFDQADSTEK